MRISYDRPCGFGGQTTTKSIVGTSTTFLYDGANAVQEVIGGTNTANSLSGGIDEVFQRTDSAGARSFLADPLGSTLALTDSTGTLQSSYTFEPFGNTTVSGSATTNSFAYTGRELDASNLYYYRARYYQPQLGRFISEDPVGLRGHSDLYSYVFDSPANGIDPSGRVTVNLGGNINVNWGVINLQWSGGIIIDTNGNIGTYLTSGGGVGVGAGAAVSLTGGFSTARTICGYAGPFADIGGNAGAVFDGGVSGFTGVDTDGATPVFGGSLSAGAGGGGELYDDITKTWVTPLFGRKPACP